MFLIYNKNTFFLIQQMRFMNNQLHIGQHGAYCTLLQSAPRKGGGGVTATHSLCGFAAIYTAFTKTLKLKT